MEQIIEEFFSFRTQREMVADVGNKLCFFWDLSKALILELVTSIFHFYFLLF